MPQNTMLDKELTQVILDADVDVLMVRSALTCHTTSGVCQNCF